jgi:predicted nucleotidyltransferase
MVLTNLQKENYKKELIKKLCTQKEIKKIVIFGSFIKSDNPNDIDVAVFQDSNDSYLNLAMKYRKLIRDISKKISIDIIPLKNNTPINSFLQEIEDGELIYAK